MCFGRLRVCRQDLFELSDRVIGPARARKKRRPNARQPLLGLRLRICLRRLRLQTLRRLNGRRNANQHAGYIERDPLHLNP